MTPLRALVIGAGHHGLVCTGSLAEAGWEVTVLERGVRPGGGVHSCLCGAGAAHAVQADASWVRPWRRPR